MSSAVYLWKTFRAQAEQDSGVSQKVFGFSPEFVFAFIPECCSESARNPVRLHPGTLFACPGIRTNRRLRTLSTILSRRKRVACGSLKALNFRTMVYQTQDNKSEAAPVDAKGRPANRTAPLGQEAYPSLLFRGWR
jgi:hypothetical protein